jgi:virginiamycin B lyase
MATITPEAVFRGNARLVITDEAVWVSNGPKNTIHKLDPKTNKVEAASRLAASDALDSLPDLEAFGFPVAAIRLFRVWISKVIATIAATASQSEGGIAASPEAAWIVTDAKGVLSRIDPASNKIVAEVEVPPNTAGATYGEGAVWITTPDKGLLTGADPKTNHTPFTVAVGPQSRFVTTGAGSV